MPPPRKLKDWVLDILAIVILNMLVLYSNFVDKDSSFVVVIQNLIPFYYKFMRDQGIICAAEVLFRTYINLFLLLYHTALEELFGYEKFSGLPVLLNQTYMCRF